MPKIRLFLAYDGTDFAGWQVQQGERTVQGVLEQALAIIHDHPVTVIGAGRTDAGVHASGQVAHFETDHRTLRGFRFREAINSYLPYDVRILASEEIDDDFHARYSALARVYRYYIYNAEIGLPHLGRYTWLVRKYLDIRILNRYASLLVGEHDFTSFTAALDPNESKVRTVLESCFFRQGPFVIYHIAARAFLWKMVRSIVGSILEFALNGRSPQYFLEVLKMRDRRAAGSTAPARGLFLEQIRYGK